MDLYHLKTFFTLARVKNFTRTAEHLFVTQSAVSHAVKKLETSVDTRLIERRGRKIALTRAGQTLFRSCEKIFYEIEKADQEIARFREAQVFYISIGSTVEFGTTILIKHIRDFLKTHPDIHLDFLFSHHLNEPLMRDEIDLAIDCRAHSDRNLEKIHLFREQYVTIASPVFLRENRIQALQDLERINILSNDKELDWWQNFLTAIPKENHSFLKNVVRINHVRGLINGALAGLGIAFVPRYTVLQELSQGILIDPFPDIKPDADDFSIFIKKEKLNFEKHRVLIDYLTRLKPYEFGVNPDSGPDSGPDVDQGPAKMS